MYISHHSTFIIFSVANRYTLGRLLGRNNISAWHHYHQSTADVFNDISSSIHIMEQYEYEDDNSDDRSSFIYVMDQYEGDRHSSSFNITGQYDCAFNNNNVNNACGIHGNCWGQYE